jgi:outer membrane protein assembly factor BamD
MLARRFLPAILLTAALAACSSSDDKLTQVEKPVGVLYTDAITEMHDENYRRAAALFDEVERQHPYSQWATRAQLMAAFAHYQNLKYDDAIVALDRFIQLHPGYENVAYAYYLKAICYYEQITDIRRDQKMTELALDSLNEVVRRFPGTPYALDAERKLQLARDHLAAKSMEIGRYYQQKGIWNAAINRFRDVIDRYQTTSHAPEALERVVECYLALGLREEAVKAASVLGYNYPNSEWYRDAYSLVNDGRTAPNSESGNSRGWFGRAWTSLSPF